MPSRIDALKEQVRVLLEQRKESEAAWCYRKLLFLGLWHRSVSVKDRFHAYMGLGRIYYSQRQYRRSALVWRCALALAERKIGAVSAEVATALDMLAYAYTARADLAAVANTDLTHVHRGEHARILWQAAFDRSPHSTQARGYIARKQQVEQQLQELKTP